MERRHVLIVDDNTALAENIAEIVETLEVDTEVVPTRADAVARIEERPFDLALVDVRLPDGDGTELAAELRRRSPLTAIVFITGDATVESAVAAVRGGAFSYIIKPFAAHELLETARRALEQVALVRESERLRRELEASERKHRQVFEAVPAFVLALDGEGRIALWNGRLEEVTGYRREEMVGRPGAEVVLGDGIRPLRVKQGAERMVRWERAQVAAGGGQGEWTYVVGTDVTREQEMLRRTLRAERLAAVGTMAAGLAHEVRNPLNSALLQLTVLMRRLERDDCSPERLRPAAELVQQEIQRLERLVKDFLAFAQPRPLELRPTDLAELCRSVLTLVQPEADAGHVRITTELAEDLLPLSADPERLRQVLLNLVKNAIEAMSDGGTLTLRTRSIDQHVEIDVEDTGPGFGDEAPVFDAFFTTKPHGTGLGLTIVHRIITDHGGVIRVRSRPGCTCFTLVLPAAAGARAGVTST